MVTGFWGRKIGMTQVFSGNKVVPVTAVDVSRWYVTGIRTQERDGYSAVQVARVRKRYEQEAFSADWLKKLKVYFGNIYEIRCKEPVQEVAVGQEVNFHQNFEVGNKVDVTGVSKGCGFAGVVKRHNFAGGRGSHGCTMGRVPGSIGFLCRNGKVVKGKKMPGHMGSKRRTVGNLEIIRIEEEPKVVLIKGSVPGKAGSVVFVRSGVKA